ncbi:unnamed protein product, partial [Urochloa humidicola]
LFLRTDHARAFLKWQLVKNKAAEMVEEMAYNVPELKDKLHFPRGPNNLYPLDPGNICGHGTAASFFHYMAFAVSSTNWSACCWSCDGMESR